MATPGIVDDGNFTTPQQNGAAVIEYPFFDKGDSTTFIATVNMRVDLDYFRVPAPMSVKAFGTLGNAFLVDLIEPSDTTQRIYEYQLVYANVPRRREEPTYATYTFQGTSLQFTDTFPGFEVYEYSVNAPLPELKIQRFISGDGVIYVIPGNTAPLNGRVLAQNSEPSRYMGKIFCRKSVFITKPVPIAS